MARPGTATRSMAAGALENNDHNQSQSNSRDTGVYPYPGFLFKEVMVMKAQQIVFPIFDEIGIPRLSNIFGDFI